MAVEYRVIGETDPEPGRCARAWRWDAEEEIVRCKYRLDDHPVNSCAAFHAPNIIAPELVGPPL